MTNWKYNHPARNMFSWAMAFFAMAGMMILALIDKDSLFWMLNQQHSYAGDLFFRYFTHVGDGLFMLAGGIILLGLGRRKLGVMILISFIVSGLIAQGVKKYKPEPRPGRYFTQIDRIHKVQDQPLTGNNSFPSGHTTTAFAFFSLLAFVTHKKGLQMFYFLCAMLVGYSRIYLGQHFFKDVYAGAIIGFFTSLLVLWSLRNKPLYLDKD
ncbi:MAG: phosphatase PAP2 family protein [Bacteroidota bacterium]